MDTTARPATSAGRIRCWSAGLLAGLLLVAVAARPHSAVGRSSHCPDEAEHCAGEPGPDDTIGPPPTPQPQPPAPYGTPRRFAYDALDGLALGVDAAIATGSPRTSATNVAWPGIADPLLTAGEQ